MKLTVFLILLCCMIFSVSLVSWNSFSDEPHHGKTTAVSQYFYVKDNFLSPAYSANGAQREELFKKVIAGYIDLINKFPHAQDVNVRAVAELQIAESYRQLGDVDMAKTYYERCISYQDFMASPPNEQDETLKTVVGTSRSKLKELR